MKESGHNTKVTIFQKIEIIENVLGEWCDGHSNWNLVSSRTKRAMGLHHQYDGEFWMDFFGDFCREYEEV